MWNQQSTVETPPVAISRWGTRIAGGRTPGRRSAGATADTPRYALPLQAHFHDTPACSSSPSPLRPRSPFRFTSRLELANLPR